MNLIVCSRSSLGPQQWGQQWHTSISKQSTQWSTIPNVSLLFNSSEHSDHHPSPWQDDLHSSLGIPNQQPIQPTHPQHADAAECPAHSPVPLCCRSAPAAVSSPAPFGWANKSAEELRIAHKINKVCCTAQQNSPPPPPLWVPSDIVSHSVIVSKYIYACFTCTWSGNLFGCHKIWGTENNIALTKIQWNHESPWLWT